MAHIIRIYGSKTIWSFLLCRVYLLTLPTQELEYKDGILVAGSLEALIDLLIPTETHYPEVRPPHAAVWYSLIRTAAAALTVQPLLLCLDRTNSIFDAKALLPKPAEKPLSLHGQPYS